MSGRHQRHQLDQQLHQLDQQLHPQLVHVGVPGPQLAAREAAAVVHEVGEVLSLEAERAVVRVVCAGLGTEGRASDD